MLTGCSPRVNAPQNLNVSMIDGKLGTLLVNWDPQPNAVKYIVQYGLGDNFDLSSGEISGTVWEATGLNSYQMDPYKQGNRDEYKFRVIGISENGKQGKASETVIGKAEVPPVTGIFVKPGRRRQLIVNWDHTPGSSHVNLRWGIANDIAASDGEAHTYGISPQGVYTITGLEDGTEYFVWIQTAADLIQNGSGQWFDGRWSRAVSGTTLVP